MTHGDHIVFMPYGPKWRKHQRIQGTLLNQQAVRHYRQLLDLESLRSLMNTLPYGEPTVSYCDAPQLKQAETIVRAFADAAGTGHRLVDAFPILKWLPNPLAPWNCFVEQIHQRTVQLVREKTVAAEAARSWNWVKHTNASTRMICLTMNFCA
ncbi:MAG: hypothetical protein Q9225_003779 [Loekoesia sp. 1 TL-2023]